MNSIFSKRKNVKKSFQFLLICMLIGGVLFYFNEYVKADDDEWEEREDEDDEKEEPGDEKKDDDDNDNESRTETIVVPERIVTVTEMNTEILRDDDQDGIINQEDPHPAIAEIYIVEDGNKNGIADWLENK